MTARTLLSVSALITIGMITGRLLGLLREMLLAANFGTGTTADMAIALLIIPDFVTVALVGNALSAVLVPAFAQRTPQRALALLWQTMMISVIVFSLIAVLCTWYFSGNAHAYVLLIAFCSIPFGAATAVITAYLQHTGRFLVPAFSNTIFNAVVLLTLWLAPDALILLALGIIAASFLRLAAHFIAFLRAGGTLWPQGLRPWQLDKKLLLAYSHTAASGICGVFPIYAPYGVVALMGGGVAVMNYAFKLLMFPPILCQTVIQLALLPWFVRIRTQHGLDAPYVYGRCLQVGWCIGIAIVLAVSIGALPIAEICFGYGKMTPADIAEVAALMRIGVWATPGLILTTAWQQMLYAHEHTRPALYSTVALALLIAPLCSLGYLAAQSQGLLAAYALAQLIPLYILSRHGHVFLGLPARPSIAYARMSAAMLVVFAAAAALYHALSLPPLLGVAFAIITGLLLIGAGIAANPALLRLKTPAG